MRHTTVGSDGTTVTVLMGERLEVHRFGGVHFFAEAKQMESGVRADFVFHA